MIVGVLDRTDDTVVVRFLALPSAKDQKKTNQGDETTNGDAYNGTNRQGSARTTLGLNPCLGVIIGAVPLGDGIGRLSELAIWTLVPGRALASGATVE